MAGKNDKDWMSFSEREAEDLLAPGFQLGLAERDPRTGLTRLVDPTTTEEKLLAQKKEDGGEK